MIRVRRARLASQLGFVAQFLGLPLHGGDYALIVMVSVLGSAATAGLTGATVMLTLTLTTLGLPLEGGGAVARDLPDSRLGAHRRQCRGADAGAGYRGEVRGVADFTRRCPARVGLRVAAAMRRHRVRPISADTSMSGVMSAFVRQWVAGYGKRLASQSVEL